MAEPSWLKTAQTYIGVKEIKGPKHNNIIVKWLDQLGAWWSNDEVPWCGVFVATVMRLHSYPIPTYYMRAKAWLDWGVRIREPVLGCIAIMERKGGGHVGFVVGRLPHGMLAILGGNQANEVNVRAFPEERILGYRLPRGWDYRKAQATPIMAGLERSTSEA